MNKIQNYTFVFFLLFVFLACTSAVSKKNEAPVYIKYVNTDVKLFWEMYSRYKISPNSSKKQIIQSYYLNKGSKVLKNCVKKNLINVESLHAALSKYPKYYESIRTNTLTADSLARVNIQKGFSKLKELYPDATFADVYFVVGAMIFGGQPIKGNLVIGMELMATDSSTDWSEFTQIPESSTQLPTDKITKIVAHELAHTLQSFYCNDLLCAALREGMCDFMAKIMTGLTSNDYYPYGEANEKTIWEDFKKEMSGLDVSGWLYNRGTIKDKPADLGYYIGHKICESYYQQATDKQQAIADMLKLKNSFEFLKMSKYEEKFK